MSARTSRTRAVLSDRQRVRVKLLQAKKGTIVEFKVVGLSCHQARQNAELLAVTLKGTRELVGCNVFPTALAFAHVRNSDLREFERFFGCPVEFGATSDLVWYSDETTALPFVAADPYRLEALKPICDEAARVAGMLWASVENEAQSLLSHGKAQRDIVAKKLAMSTRTLSRMLADEGTTYEEVVGRTLALHT
jgi:hypothetical protein